MKPNLLFPPVFRIIGIILLLPGLISGYIYICRDQVIALLDFQDGNLTDEFGVTFTVTGLIFIGFSVFKYENEQIAKTRLNALYWSVLVNWLFYIFYFVIDNLKVPYFLKDCGNFIFKYNLFLLLFLFLIRFLYLLYFLKKGNKIKKLYFLPYRSYVVGVKIISVAFLVSFILSFLKVERIDNFLKWLPNWTFNLSQVCVFVWLWSMEKNEIGVVKNIRLEAIQVAFYIGYSLFILLTWVVYGFDYLFVLGFGFFVFIILFFIIFYTQLYLTSRKMKKKLAAN